MKLRVRRTGCIAVGLIIFGLLLPVVYAHWLAGSIAPLDCLRDAVVSFGYLFAFFSKRRVASTVQQNGVVDPEARSKISGAYTPAL